MFVITRLCYVGVLFHTFYYYWAEEHRSLYRGLHHIAGHYVGFPLYIPEISVPTLKEPTNTRFQDVDILGRRLSLMSSDS